MKLNLTLLSLCLAFGVSSISCKKGDDNPPSQPDTNFYWQKALGGTLGDQGNAVIKAADGGTVIAGFANSGDGDVTGAHGTDDVWIVKLDTAGNKQWARAFGGSGNDVTNAILNTADGGYILAASTNSTDGDATGNHGNFDILIIKLDAAGNKQWSTILGDEGTEMATDIISSPDGGYLVTGLNDENPGRSTGGEIAVMKLDANGQLLWNKTYGGSDYDVGFAIVTTADGGYAIGGYTRSTDGDITGSHGNGDALVLKLDAAGNKQWLKTYGGSSIESCNAMIGTADGGFIITGDTGSSDGDVTGTNAYRDIWVLKLGAAGDKQWSKTYGGSVNDEGISICSTPDGGYALTGVSQSNDGDITNNRGLNDLVVMKLDASGNKQLVKTFGGPGEDYGLSIVPTPDGKYVVAGHTSSTSGDVTGQHGGLDMWVLQVGL